jgi:hypothetical protein
MILTSTGHCGECTMDGRTCQMGWDSVEWQKHELGEWLLFYSSNSSTHYDTPSDQGMITDRRVEESKSLRAW